MRDLRKGVRIGNDIVSILLYADDMALIASSEQDLQFMITKMNEWMKKWCMKVNVEKTKIVHFRKPRCSKTKFRFKYDDNVIEVVDSYKHLGVYLDEHLNFTKCTDILTESAGRALGGVISKFKTLKDCGYKTFNKLFETAVLPVLCYGAEIWGYGSFSKCDTIYNRAMRYFLGVHRYAPSAGIQGEMSWMSLKYKRYLQMLTFWNRLNAMDNSRLTKRVFMYCLDNYNGTWCEDIRKVSIELSMENIYNMKGRFIKLDVIDKCRCITQNELLHQINTKPKLRIYKEVKNSIVTEPYLLSFLPKHVRSIFAQFRLGILPLHIETGRFVNIYDEQTKSYRKMKPEERTCKICDSGEVEDEIHFLFVCNKYTEQRDIFFNKCINVNPNFINMSHLDKLRFVMQHQWKEAAQYITNIWYKRKTIEYL